MESNNKTDINTVDNHWNSLCIIGGVAALFAGIIFRRNLAVEIGMFVHDPAPVTVNDWFALLQSNRLLGLTYLHIFDVVNYALISLMFLALYVVLKRINRSLMAIAASLGLMGITVFFASNTAFSLVSLSEQYAAATSEAQRNLLLAAGQSMLAVNRFTNPGGQPGAGGYISLLLIAVAGLIISVVMTRSREFKRVTAYIGILATSLDLAYCLAYTFVPGVDTKLLALCFIPAAGLLLMVWHIMVGWRLWKLGRTSYKIQALNGGESSTRSI